MSGTRYNFYQTKTTFEMNEIKVIPLDISETWDNRRALKEQAKRVISRAKDENRDLTKEEATTVTDLVNLSDQIDEQVYRMAGVNMDSTDEIGGLYKTTQSDRGLWGDTAYDLAKGSYDRISTRGLTSTTGAATIQNPSIMTEYIGSLTHMNPLADLGVRFQASNNYSAWPYASGEPVVSYQGAEGDAISIDTAWSIAQRKATFCTAAVIIKVSKQLLFDGNAVPRIIDNEITTAFQNSILTKFMQGSGSAEPYGMDNLTGIQTADINGSAYGLDDYITWSTTLVGQRVRPQRIGYLHGASSWGYAAKLKDDQSRYLDKPELLREQIWGTSSAVKETYTSTRTKIYGGDFSNSRILFQSGPGYGGNGYAGIQVLDQLYAGTFEVGYLAWLRYDIQHFRPEQLIRIDGVPLT